MKNFEELNTLLLNEINDFSVVSLGQACRLCQYLDEYNIRTKSFPFDWLRMYDLDIILIYLLRV